MADDLGHHAGYALAPARPVEAPAATGTGFSDQSVTVPFSIIDEAVHLLDVEAAPWSIQMELRLEGRLDESRLRHALIAATGRHWMARARKKPNRRSAHFDNWEIPATIDVDPLRVVDCPDDETLNRVRDHLQGFSVPLAESPPLRVRLARHPGGDVLMLNVNHAAMDGFGVLRFLQSVARAYTGSEDPLPALDFSQVRDLPKRLAAPSLAVRLRRQLVLLSKVRDLIGPPARLAKDGATRETGYGFHLVQLSEPETRALVELDHSGTVNDALLAALHQAIAAWNEEHGAHCGRIGVLVPANLRPQEWRHDMVGNFSLPTRIATSRRARRGRGGALKSVTKQTRRKKQVGMGTALIEVLGHSQLLPLWVKQLMVLSLPLTGNRLVDTAMLSNVGALTDLPSFGPEAGAVTELWFSPPARMPLGLALGVATAAGRIHLTFRYRHRLWSPDAAKRFAHLYLEQLHHVA